MRTLKISTYLAADLETVKSYLMTPALIDYFKESAEIMIATEAAAEGVNLQF